MKNVQISFDEKLLKTIIQKANLSKPSFVQADHLHTIPKDLLEKYVGTLDSLTMLEVSRKVVLALELESCIYIDT